MGISAAPEEEPEHSRVTYQISCDAASLGAGGGFLVTLIAGSLGTLASGGCGDRNLGDWPGSHGCSGRNFDDLDLRRARSIIQRFN